MSNKPAVIEQPPLAMEPVGGDTSLVSMIERVAANPNASMDVLERLMAMHERAAAKVAQEQFHAALSAAQKAMRPVAADADNPQTRSRYASYAALDRALRPIYTEHGFGLSFDTGDGAPESWVRILCHVSHAGGHSHTYHADMPADGKGAKGGDVMTKTHAVGAAMSYGMRYLLKMIFNVAVGEDDRDGNGATSPVLDMPDGFQDWWDDIKATADAGLAVLKAAWTASPAHYRTYVTKTNLQAWEAVKAAAAKVQP